jgi:non-specific serine/threonine protein kinase
MSKVYSNKALPSGTVLREWRLEEVLGVGGFGIVYKARGIYFDELVAIKEYFPSSISERQEDDTIVPVDSDAEEVHALGLKKFVEEAKLLWNLSTPSRHPNIVSVRSLFEIHGTAYMVMDFEDGVSLSKLLKEGRRFNQASLTALIQPIAEGLERAHRVGVLHRDIKPANILVAPDGRPVLIDFGSARFESGDATSTTVTFHTPPYAAIEQYVKNYEQGPWTDVYALGVVLYECVTGEKPAEVLERMHGSADKPLAEGEWPGFSRAFLAAIDTAMTIRPDERPRSIAEWLPMISAADDAVPVNRPVSPPIGEETIVSIVRSSPDEIKPIAPPAPGFETIGTIKTSVPETPSKAEFRGAGQTTKGDVAPVIPTPPIAEPAPPKAEAPSAAKPAPPPQPKAAQPSAPVPPQRGKPAVAGKPASGGKSSKGPLIAVGAVALLLAAGGGWYLLNGGLSPKGAGDEQDAASLAASEAVPSASEVAALASEQGYSTLIEALSADAKAAKVAPGATAPLDQAAAQLKALEGQSGAGSNSAEMLKQAGVIASAAAARFVDALGAEVDGKAQRLAREIPWAGPGRAAAYPGLGADKKGIAASLARTRGSLGSARSAIQAAQNPGEAIVIARQALAASQGFSAAYFQAFRAGPSVGKDSTQLAQTRPQIETEDTAPVVQTPSRTQVAPAQQGGGNEGVSAGTRAEFNSVVASARSAAAEIRNLGTMTRPDSGATEAEKTRYQIRLQNAQTAKRYEDYLNTLSRSMAGIDSESEARQSLAKANQTQGYLTTLLRGSRLAAGR